MNPEQHAAKRARILDAAADEFAAHGVDGTSTAAICRRAGIGSGTLFHYFPTKRELFHALFSSDLPRNAQARERALSCARAADGLDLLVEHLLADLRDPRAPGLAAAALLQANRDVEFALMLTEDDTKTRAALNDVLARMADEGHRMAFAPQRVARWLQTLIDTSFLTADDDDEFDAETQIAELHAVIAWLTGAQ